jgi:cobalt-zinc-cadmium efflux system outer membrane protein
MKFLKHTVFNLTINSMGSSILRPYKTLTASLSIAVICLMAGLVAPARAETLQVITINELINTVVLNNPELSASRQSLDAASAGITSAKALPNPRLEMQSGRHNELNPAALSGRANGIDGDDENA